MRIESASEGGIPRIVELVNRTNQFNVAASRIGLAEMRQSLRNGDLVLVASAEDKFGSMGVVGVMQVSRKQDRIEIPVFVLSCRAFGFGVEYALLNSLKGRFPADCAIVGHYRETSQNGPGRRLYLESGMKREGDCWVGKVGDLPNDPEWLDIQRLT